MFTSSATVVYCLITSSVHPFWLSWKFRLRSKLRLRLGPRLGLRFKMVSKVFRVA